MCQIKSAFVKLHNKLVIPACVRARVAKSRILTATFSTEFLPEAYTFHIWV